MARIAGIDLPKDKRIEIGLTYIYGIGRKSVIPIHKCIHIRTVTIFFCILIQGIQLSCYDLCIQFIPIRFKQILPIENGTSGRSGSFHCSIHCLQSFLPGNGRMLPYAFPTPESAYGNPSGHC